MGADNAGGAYKGARYLIDRGYRQIGILAGFQRLSSMRERLQGFRQALAEANIPIPEEWIVTSELSIEAGTAATVRLLTAADRPGCAVCQQQPAVTGRAAGAPGHASTLPTGYRHGLL